jgi:tetratricopeptide (TPR) repeat protein
MASPNDLSSERRTLKTVIDALNEGFADGIGVRFHALGWEDVLASTGRRPQSVINAEVDRCHIFLLVLFRKWGQKAQDSEYSSYTEEEYRRALRRFEDSSSPEIFVFFKEVDLASVADPGPQLKKVLRFRRSLEDSKRVLYRTFTDQGHFAKEVDRHLRGYARGKSWAFASETTLTAGQIVSGVVFARTDYPELALYRLEQGRHASRPRTASQLSKLEVKLAMKAMEAADEGKLQHARELFAEIAGDTDSVDSLKLCWTFYRRIGDPAAAIALAKRILDLEGAGKRSLGTAEAMCFLGFSFLDIGALDNAAHLFERAGEIGSELDDTALKAEALGALGIVAYSRGEPVEAERLFSEALDNWTTAGSEAGQARQYGNLAQLRQERGDGAGAEELYRKGLELCERLGLEQEKARHFCNLGLIYMDKGELDVAERMHRAALEIDQRLGWKKGMASHFANLGAIERRRGNLKEARKLLSKARELFEEIGRFGAAEGIGQEIESFPIM